MTFVPITNGAEVECVYTLFDRPLEVTLHFVDRSPPVTTAHLGLLAVTVGQWQSEQVLPLLSSDLTLNLVRATDQTTFGGASATDVTFAGPGGVGISSYTAIEAAVISLVPFIGARVRRNRNYVAGIHGGVVSRSRLSAAFVSALEDAYDTLIDRSDTINWRWVAVSRFLDNSPRSTALTARIDHSRVFRPVVGQMRRRKLNSFT